MNIAKKEKDVEGLDNDVQQSPINNHDDVFGEISESGPNYRNVRFLHLSLLESGAQNHCNTQIGRMVWYCRAHDEKSDWTRRPFYPECF